MLPQSVDDQTLQETSRTLIAVFKECGTARVSAILADKQLIGNANLQFRSILSQRDCMTLAAGYPSGKIDADAAEKSAKK